MLTLALEIQLGSSKEPGSHFRYCLCADGLAKPTSRHMLILVGKTDPDPLLSSHIGVDVEVPRKVIFKIQRRPVSVKATVQHFMDVWVDL